MLDLQYDLPLLTNWDVLVEVVCKDIVEQHELAIVEDVLDGCRKDQQLFLCFPIIIFLDGK